MDGAVDGLAGLVVAIDGTAGSGKSTASRAVASRLGLRYLDTGAMYRAMTCRMLRRGVDVTDPAAVARAAEGIELVVSTDPDHQTVHVDGVNVTAEIRESAATSNVSAVSAVPEVRAVLVAQQRELMSTGGIVVEGRDIGTVVAPSAQVKVYLTADPLERARRRAAELAPMAAIPGGGGEQVRTVEADLLRRDALDSGRAASPLAAAADAVILDTTDITLDQVVDEIVGLAMERAGGR